MIHIYFCRDIFQMGLGSRCFCIHTRLPIPHAFLSLQGKMHCSCPWWILHISLIWAAHVMHDTVTAAWSKTVLSFLVLSISVLAVLLRFEELHQLLVIPSRILGQNPESNQTPPLLVFCLKTEFGQFTDF